MLMSESSFSKFSHETLPGSKQSQKSWNLPWILQRKPNFILFLVLLSFVLKILADFLHISIENKFLTYFKFAEFYGQLIANCWYSPKNCQHDAIRTFSQCQADVSWILDLLQVDSNPFVVQSAVHGLNAIFKAIGADDSDHPRTEKKSWRFRYSLFRNSKLCRMNFQGGWLQDLSFLAPLKM